MSSAAGLCFTNPTQEHCSLCSTITRMSTLTDSVSCQPLTKPHAVVLPYPAQGHINPMMQLSKILVTRGFSITFVNTEINHRRIIRAQGCDESRFSSSGKPLENEDIRLAVISDGLPREFNRVSNYMAFMNSVQEQMAENFDEFTKKLLMQDGLRVTYIISDWFLPWAHNVAKKYSIPWINFWPQSTAVYSIYSQAAFLSSEGYDPFKDGVGKALPAETAKLLIERIPALQCLNSSDLPFFEYVDESFSQWLFRIADLSHKTSKEALWVLSNSFCELESAVHNSLEKLSLPIHPIGPLLPSAFLDGDNPLDHNTARETSLWTEDKCTSWLDMQSPNSVIYVSVGSMVPMSQAQIEEMALGLKASQQPFLWVIRVDPEVPLQVTQILPEGFTEDTKQQGLIISWAPQLNVLSHSAVGGFLTHCGWNSVLESISIGVPMLVWPKYLDQRTHAKLVVDEWQVGLKLVPEGDAIGELIDRVQIERSVRKLMEGQEGRVLRGRVAKLKDAARSAVGKGGSSQNNLDKFSLYMHELM